MMCKKVHRIGSECSDMAMQASLNRTRIVILSCTDQRLPVDEAVGRQKRHRLTNSSGVVLASISSIASSVSSSCARCHRHRRRRRRRRRRRHHRRQASSNQLRLAVYLLPLPAHFLSDVCHVEIQSRTCRAPSTS